MIDRRGMLIVGGTMAAAGLGSGSGASTDHPDLGLFKAIYLVKRRSDFSFEAFVRYQEQTHIPLAHALPGLRRYRLDYFPPMPDGTEQPFDAMASLWFDDKAAHDAALGSEPGQAALGDLPNFLQTDELVALFGHTGNVRDDFPA